MSFLRNDLSDEEIKVVRQQVSFALQAIEIFSAYLEQNPQDRNWTMKNAHLCNINGQTPDFIPIVNSVHPDMRIGDFIGSCARAYKYWTDRFPRIERSQLPLMANAIQENLFVGNPKGWETYKQRLGALGLSI